MNAILFLSTALLLAQAGDAASPPNLKARVAQLVRQLDENQLAKREQAEKELIALGADALEFLPSGTGKAVPAEMKERLGRVKQALETAAAEAVSKGKTVTLDGEMTLAEALAALEKQTGNKVGGAENRGGKVKTGFDKTPYWAALDKLLDQAGLSINPFGGFANTLTLAARPEEELPRFGRADYRGLFRFEPIRVDAVRDLRNPQVRGVRVKTSITWEPRLAPITLEQPLSQIEATDENGQPLAVDGRRGSLHANVQTGISAVEIDVPLALPERSVKKIASLKGKLTALIPGRVETFEFANIDQAKDEELRKAGVTVTLEKVRKNVELYEVRMLVRFDEAANALESHRGWIYNNEAYLLDAAGQKVENAGYQATRQEENAVGLAYIFDLEKGSKNCKFVYKTPALIVRLPVEFELKDIELP